jgi:hypothetical protein
VRGGATRSARASVAARALVVVAVVGDVAAAQQKPIDPNDRFAGRPDEPELDAAIQIDHWLEATAVRLDDGWAWPAVPDDWAGRTVPKESLDPSLYSGSAGILLFGIALAEATAHTGPDGSRTSGSPFLELPDRAAAHLIATLPTKVEGEGCGLYTGIAGIGFALREWSEVTHRVEGDRAARRCVELLGAAARPADTGIEWSDCTDVISGGAGIGLFLTYMAETDRDPLARELAIRAGRRLLDLGERESVGRSWRMDPTFARVMPNFSHGTAGVAFFLARLYELTGDVEFLDGALDGARHVFSLADTSDGGCRVFHHSNETDSKDDAEGRLLQYLGWCHGPVGAAQLFMKLAQVSGDADWTDHALRCAKSVRDSGIPEKETPGFWMNVGLCCGSAGVANFFETLALARWDPIERFGISAPRDDDLVFARRCLGWTLEHGTRDRDGLRFPQVEHRVKPELVEAQVGLMQGAAGVGLVALRLAHGLGRLASGLPDDPTADAWGRPLALFPAGPAAEPDAATTAFENCSRGVLFQADALRHRYARTKPLREATPKALACDSWFDAAEAAGAKLVVLQARDRSGFALWDDTQSDDDVENVRKGEDLVASFVQAARARRLVVGLSVALDAMPADRREDGAWLERARRRVRELLMKYGPLSLLRIEVPVEVRDWPSGAGDVLYSAAKACGAGVLVEFMTFDPVDDAPRARDGVQRVGIRGVAPPEAGRPDGRPWRADALWPTDVVADFETGPSEFHVVTGNYVRPHPSPAQDGPWREFLGRRRYVPLQIELAVDKDDGDRLQRATPTRPPDPTFSGGVADEVRVAAARARNLLFVVNFENDGSLDRGTIAALRELGRR